MQREPPPSHITLLDSWLESNYPHQVRIDKSNGEHLREYVNTQNPSYIVRVHRDGDMYRVRLYPANEVAHLIFVDPNVGSVQPAMPSVEFGETVYVFLGLIVQQSPLIMGCTKERMFRGAIEYVCLEHYSTMPALTLVVLVALFLNLNDVRNLN